MAKKKKISRPPRVYKTTTGRQYVIINGKRKYITPANKPVRKNEAFNVMIKNINKITEPRRRSVRRSRKYSVMKRPYQNQLRSGISHGGVSGSTSGLTTPAASLLAGALASSRDRLGNIRLLENRDNSLENHQRQLEFQKLLGDQQKQIQDRIDKVEKDSGLLKEAGRYILFNQERERIAKHDRELQRHGYSGNVQDLSDISNVTSSEVNEPEDEEPEPQPQDQPEIEEPETPRTQFIPNFQKIEYNDNTPKPIKESPMVNEIPKLEIPNLQQDKDETPKQEAKNPKLKIETDDDLVFVEAPGQSKNPKQQLETDDDLVFEEPGKSKSEEEEDILSESDLKELIEEEQQLDKQAKAEKQEIEKYMKKKLTSTQATSVLDNLGLATQDKKYTRREFLKFYEEAPKQMKKAYRNEVESVIELDKLAEAIESAEQYLKHKITDKEAAQISTKLDLPIPDRETGKKKPYTARGLRQHLRSRPGEKFDVLNEIIIMKQGGLGSTHKGKGLYDHEIEEIMRPYKRHGFLGVVPIDKVSDLDPGNKKRISFVMNTDPSDKPGKHWVSVYIDGSKDMTVEYYDSYAREPTKEFLKEIKQLLDKMGINSYLKMKVNKVIDQATNTDTCGFLASGFLIDRYDGIPFKECSRFNNVEEGERKAYKLKKRFGFI